MDGFLINFKQQHFSFQIFISFSFIYNMISLLYCLMTMILDMDFYSHFSLMELLLKHQQHFFMVNSTFYFIFRCIFQVLLISQILLFINYQLIFYSMICMIYYYYTFINFEYKVVEYFLLLKAFLSCPINEPLIDLNLLTNFYLSAMI